LIGDSTPPSFPDYRSFYSSHIPDQGHHGGTAILVRNDVAVASQRLNTSLQAVAIKLFINRPYTICSLYLPPSESVGKVILENLLHEISSPYLILGDLNGRHPHWGDVVSNSRGMLISSLIEEMDIGILNTGEMTSFHIQTGTFTAIDLSLCSTNTILDFSWKVLDDLHGSDHYPIVLESTTSEPQRRLPRWRLDKADWNLFETLSSTNRCIDEFHSAEEAVTYFTDKIHSAAVLSVPKTSGTFRKRPVPWWNENCSTAVKAKRTAFARLRRHRGDPQCMDAFRQARAHARWVMKNARRASWRNYVTSINAQTPIKEVFSKIRKISGKFSRPPPPVLSLNGVSVADPKSVADIFVKHFASVSKKDPSAPGSRHRRELEALGVNFASIGGESYNVPFSLSELKMALSECHDSSPGSDDIPYALLRHMSDSALSFLMDLFNLIWHTGDFPSSWRVGVILPIPKPGKDHLQATNYRPISLTSCICKVLEKMVNVRLMWYLERGSFLTPVQYGFRKARSTSDALLSLESSICEAFAKNHHQVTMFFDLEKAYDTAWCHGILLTLFEFGLRGHLPIFIQSFLAQRLLQVRVGNVLSEICPVEDGVPQGSILSVTLFAVAINGVVGVLPEGVHSCIYVDDLSISFSAARMPLIERKLQLAINRVSSWANKRGFRFSSSKTVAMHFCRIRGVHPDPDLYLENKRVSCVETTRYLGLVFDNRLTWLPHFRYVKAACQKALTLLRVLSHTSWGADRDTLLRLHRTLILSKLEYGCEVYSSATEPRLRMLDSVHHAGVRLATGAFRTSPIPSLLVDAGALPLDLRRQSILLRCWYRIHRLPESVTCVTVCRDSRLIQYVARPSLAKPFGFRVKSIMEQLSLPDIPICPHRFPKIGSWEFPDVAFCGPDIPKKSLLPPRQSYTLFFEHFSTHSDSTPVFTDGSKSDAGVGYGVVFPSFCRGGTLPAFASVFTAEISAIILALQIIFTLPVSSFTIFSDSRSALASLQFFTPSSQHPLILSIFEWLYLLIRRGYVVRFCWVPGHVGVPGNEKADRLAGEGATHAPPQSPVPFRDMFCSIRVAVLDTWKRRWEVIGATTKMREITDKVFRPWSYADVHGRRAETALSRLRMGHTRLTHSFLVSGDVQPYCDDCLVPLTVRHLLVECPSLGELRDRYLYRCRGEGREFRLSEILGERCLSPGREVLDFLEKAGLLHLI